MTLITPRVLRRPMAHGPADWWRLELTEEELERLYELGARGVSSNSKVFKLADRREEVRLRARKRGALAGPEDSFRANIDKVGGLTGAQRWSQFLTRARQLDGAPLEPVVVNIAKPPITQSAKAKVTWLNESSKARCYELLTMEELLPEFTRLWESPTRPQLDLGKKPVQPGE